MSKPTYYAILPANVRYDENLTPNAKLLYAEITVLTQSNGICWASDNYFMDLYKVERRTIQNWLKQLEDRGYIARKVVYKKESKEIEKRFITLVNINAQGYGKYIHKGMENICTENTTSINNTSINKDIVESSDSTIPYKEIIDYLNDKTNKNYRNVKTNKRLIKARFNEGYTLEDFKQVIDNMNKAWGNDNKMKNYLRPATLFGTKFDSYLNYEAGSKEEIELDIKMW